MQGDPECHHLTLKHVIDHSLNRNLNDPPTALKSMFLTTDTLLTSTAQSLALLIRLIPDAQMNGHHLENLTAHPPTTLHAQMHDHHPQNLSGPINVKLMMSYIEPINSKSSMIYSELINATSSIRMIQTSIQRSTILTSALTPAT
jgi:N-acetyl-beta-hexosaminidase